MLDLILLLVFLIAVVFFNSFLARVNFRYYNKYMKKHIEYEVFESDYKWQDFYGAGKIPYKQIVLYILLLSFGAILV